MKIEHLEKMLFNVMNAPMNLYPFPHFATSDVFPRDAYDDMLKYLPPLDAYTGIGETGKVQGYDKEKETRFMFGFEKDMDKLEGETQEFWQKVMDFMAGERFANNMIGKFAPFISKRFRDEGQKKISYRLDLLRDFTGYELGPHTDHGHRLLNVFFYLPKDNDHPHMGTSFYVPKDPNFTCKGGPHHKFEDFINVYTVQAHQNVAAGFFRNEKSFHGVEPVEEKGYERNALTLAMFAD